MLSVVSSCPAGWLSLHLSNSRLDVFVLLGDNGSSCVLPWPPTITVLEVLEFYLKSVLQPKIVGYS